MIKYVLLLVFAGAPLEVPVVAGNFYSHHACRHAIIYYEMKHPDYKFECRRKG